jgi:hypothetical protein
MNRKIRCWLGALLLLAMPYSASADMMDRTTPGDMMFFTIGLRLVLAGVLSFALWIIALLTRRAPKVRRFLGYAALVLAGAFCLTVVSGTIYYHYLGYGAYKKAHAKLINTRNLLRIVDYSCAIYAAEYNRFPSDERQVLAACREYGHDSLNEHIKQGSLVDSWGTEIKCTLKENGVLLRSAGPDGRFNTEDDLANSDP